ncbi:glycoside hydrolase family 16 protein [Aurantiacibacter luteus]|uniref:glycoside hydrolase family 16 protein n=1 Tax=Aurantiacibacter luteus TaxID=1581420 RepID=UPI001F4C94E8|nr:glycoside hydrolase family 16 protein [Aurantiacibacter luteus]
MGCLSSLAIAVATGCGGGGSSASAPPVAGTPPSPSPSPTPSPTPTPTSGTAGNWQLVWAEEFSGNALDPARWRLFNDCWGGGNEERQCYTPRAENVSVEGGNLVLTARREAWTGPAQPGSSNTASKPFTSGKIATQGLQSWTYGRFEMRARFPQGQGVWPAFWMLPEPNSYGGWAASGEIDILEAINPGVVCPTCEAGGENSIYGTLHFGGAWPDNRNAGRNRSFPGLTDGQFHTYGVIWERGRFTWTVDGEAYGSLTSDQWFTTASADPQAPFDRPFHLILNLAIGGRWPEANALGGVSDQGFPKRMEVDWVRVWQCDADPASGQGCNRGS